MNRHGHTTDTYVRRLPLVSDEQVRLLSDSDAKQALFEEITTMTIDTRTAPPAQDHARVPRRTFVLAAAVALLSVAAVGWAVFNSVQGSTSVGCHTGDGAVSIVDAVTGDPVSDCAALWRQDTGTQPPPLVAYDNGDGGIEVVPEGSSIPRGWQPLEPGVTQDPRLIELEAALDDHIDGLPADCHPLDAARTIAEREVDRLGLDGWQVVAERGEADGAGTCTYFLLESERQTVVLIPLDGGAAPDDAPYSVLAGELGTALEQGCLSLPDAAAQARQIAADAGIGEALVVHEVTDDAATCARADVNVGGGVEVTIRGPQATP